MKIWVEFGSNQDENVENEKLCKKEKYLQQKNQNNGNKFGLTGPVSAVNSLPVIPRGHTNHFNHSYFNSKFNYNNFTILCRNTIKSRAVDCLG